MMDVSGGTSKPAMRASLVGAWPTHCGLMLKFGITSSLPSASFCASVAMYALLAFSNAMMRSRSELSATSACSLEHTVP